MILVYREPQDMSCVKCKPLNKRNVLLYSFFHIHKRSYTGYRYMCRKCKCMANEPFIKHHVLSCYHDNRGYPTGNRGYVAIGQHTDYDLIYLDLNSLFGILPHIYCFKIEYIDALKYMLDSEYIRSYGCMFPDCEHRYDCLPSAEIIHAHVNEHHNCLRQSSPSASTFGGCLTRQHTDP